MNKLESLSKNRSLFLLLKRQQHAFLPLQARKPHLGRWLDSFGEVYARIVIAATLASFLGLLAVGVPVLSASGQRGALYRALGLLTTASPCALVLVPLAYVSAIATVTQRYDAYLRNTLPSIASKKSRSY